LPESPETVQRDLRELGPSTILAPPRHLENMLTAVQVRAADATPLKRRTFEYCPRSGRAAEILPRRRQTHPGGPSPRHGLGEFFVYRPSATSSAFAQAKWALTGGAPLGPDTFRFFRSIGVNLKQVYGSTETTGLVSLQPDHEGESDHGRADPSRASRSRSPTAARLLVRGCAVFRGYLKNEEATREVIDPTAGSIRGTPASSIRAGTSSSSTAPRTWGRSPTARPFAPQFFENKLKYSPFIREAVAFGHERHFVAA